MHKLPPSVEEFVTKKRGGRVRKPASERLGPMVGVRLRQEDKRRVDLANALEGGAVLPARFRAALLAELENYLDEMRKARKIPKELRSELRRLPKRPPRDGLVKSS